MIWDNMLYWLVFLIGFNLLFPLIKKLFNNLAKDGISDEEIERITSEGFPKIYSLFYGTVIFLFIIIMVGGSLLLGLGFMSIQKSIFLPDNYILFISSDLSYGVFFISGVFILPIPIGLIISYIIHKFPEFERYCRMREIQAGFYPMSLSEEVKITLKMLLVILVITIPLLLLSLFNYAYITEEGVFYNEFFTLSEKVYKWADIKKVKISYQTVRKSERNKSNLKPEYILELEKEKEINLWNGRDFIKHAEQINSYLASWGIPSEVSPIDGKTFIQLSSRFSNKEYNEVMKKLYEKGLEKHVEQLIYGDNVTLRAHVKDVLLLADMYASEGKDSKAIHLYREALKVDSRHLDYQLKLARLLYKQGNTEEAIEKAGLVYLHAEDANLIEDAQNFLSALGIVSPCQKYREQNKTSGKIKIIVVPIGKVNRTLLCEVVNELQERMGIEYCICENAYDPGEFDRDYLYEYKDNPGKKLIVSLIRLLPQYKERIKYLENHGQFDASRLNSELQVLYDMTAKPEIKGYLGITEEDIFSKDFNFLFGWARKRYGVVSYHRFRASFTGEPPDRSRLRERTVKQAICSSFHILGIPGCTSADCVRAYPNSLAEHDCKPIELCPWCKDQLNACIETNN